MLPAKSSQRWGCSTQTLALMGSAAVLVSRYCGRKPWPYIAAALLVSLAVLWIVPAGFTRNLDVHFEWNSADGFEVFRVQDEAGAPWRPLGTPVLQSIVETQIQPPLRGYFKMNDWQKMNGDIGIKVVRIIPIAWPVDLGNGGETLEDPDETELMRAAAKQDLSAIQKLLSASAKPDVNALDQTGQTALILACESPKASPAVIKALLTRAGADANQRSRNGYTALAWRGQKQHRSDSITATRRRQAVAFSVEIQGLPDGAAFVLNLFLQQRDGVDQLLRAGRASRERKRRPG